MLIYRVEHRDAINGPYTYYPHDEWDELRLEMANKHTCCGCHPTPWDDDTTCFDAWSDHHCGFVAPEDLLRWFRSEKCGDWIEPLAQYGFHVVVHEVPEAHILWGQVQCVFPMNEAALATKLDLLELAQSIQTNQPVGAS